MAKLQSVSRLAALSLFLGAPHLAQAASISGTFLPHVSSITDENGKIYTLVDGVIRQNGVADTRTAGVTEVLYFKGLIFQEISSGAWWSTPGTSWPKSVWTTVTGSPLVESANGATIPSAAQIVGADQKIYALANGAVYQNGVEDTRTSGVTLLLYYGGLIYQEISAGAWWSTDGSGWPNSVWTETKDPRATGTPIPVPSGAASAGYTKLVLNDNFATLPASELGQVVDLNNTQAEGYHWYPAPAWGDTSWQTSNLPGAGKPPANVFTIVKESDGTSALRILGTDRGFSLYTQHLRKDGTLVGCGYGGTVKGCAKADSTGSTYSGTYYEARIAFENAVTTGNTGGPSTNSAAAAWPAFWAVQTIPSERQWPGAEKNYNNNIEMDIMEYMPETVLGTKTGVATFTEHDWFGVQNVTCSGYCQPGKNATSHYWQYNSGGAFGNYTYHTFGALIFPSKDLGKKDANGEEEWSEGYVRYYLDNVPKTTVTFYGPIPENTNPKDTAWTPPTLPLPNVQGPTTTYGTTSLWTANPNTKWTHFVSQMYPYALILSAGGNNNMDVQYVRIWQAP